ncbi:CU044_2847 family protein [Nostoc sp. UHCC 0926]|uniref:CU044_2847 family protein n=1 Tax=unclassified Nostoc TaxID=2593658 RepID=UPI00235FA968|nr:CU044_2847 family protein [Nostoc sp. UHCC 0926]WDD33850.1 CU044_2847 family protein [Nostoc sp. UHCC 0926]
MDLHIKIPPIPSKKVYTIYTFSAFKDFNTAEIEEVKLTFGIKLGGKAGIPYITEGSAESNLQIEVKCKFPEKQKPDSQ